MAAAASHSETLSLGPLCQEGCEVCRDSTPGDSSVDFLRVSGRFEVTVQQLLAFCWALPLALHMALGHGISPLVFLPLCPCWVHCFGKEIVLPLHTGLLAKRALSPLSCPSCWNLLKLDRGLNFSELALEFCLLLFWQEEWGNLSPAAFLPCTARQLLGYAAHHHLSEEISLMFLWSVFRSMGRRQLGRRGAKVENSRDGAGERLLTRCENERWNHLEVPKPSEWRDIGDCSEAKPFSSLELWDEWPKDLERWAWISLSIHQDIPALCQALKLFVDPLHWFLGLKSAKEPSLR